MGIGVPLRRTAQAQAGREQGPFGPNRVVARQERPAGGERIWLGLGVVLSEVELDRQEKRPQKRSQLEVSWQMCVLKQS